MGAADKHFTDGEAYERMMGRWSRPVGKIFLDWLDAPRGRRWLDVGCGNGAFTEEIVARCAPATVKAIDPSDEQLAFARTRPGTKMAKFEVGDAQKLSPYECGFEAYEDARMRFDVRYYLVAILFIVFDLEIAFLFPWAVSLAKIGVFGRISA